MKKAFVICANVIQNMSQKIIAVLKAIRECYFDGLVLLKIGSLIIGAVISEKVRKNYLLR